MLLLLVCFVSLRLLVVLLTTQKYRDLEEDPHGHTY